jgi:hypothetical protein
MAIGDPYVSLDELKDYLKMTGKASYDDALLDAISSVTAEIERKCNRQFNKAGSVSQRSYYPDSSSLAKVHDFWTTTGLVVTLNGNTLTEGTDFELHPLDGIVDGQPGWPYWKIRLLGGRCFARDTRLGAPLKVSANWGWDSVPAPIKQACLIMAAETFQLKDTPYGVAGMTEFGSSLRVKDNAMAASKISPYVRDRFLVG